jgi:predicted nucleic acid-binding protein
MTIEVHETGFGLAERYGLSIYDAMIAASALHAGCDTRWSGDMQHEMPIENRRLSLIRSLLRQLMSTGINE